MNCKQGDMAWVVRTTYPGASPTLRILTRQLLGIPVRCLSLVRRNGMPAAWMIAPEIPLRDMNGERVLCNAIEDALLEPIRNEGEPAELTDPRELTAT